MSSGYFFHYSVANELQLEVFLLNAVLGPERWQIAFSNSVIFVVVCMSWWISWSRRFEVHVCGCWRAWRFIARQPVTLPATPRRLIRRANRPNRAGNDADAFGHWRRIVGSSS